MVFFQISEQTGYVQAKALQNRLFLDSHGSSPTSVPSGLLSDAHRQTAVIRPL